MTRTNKKPDDALNRLTGSSAHEAAHETAVSRVAGEALEADAVIEEADAELARFDQEQVDDENFNDEHLNDEQVDEEHLDAVDEEHLDDADERRPNFDDAPTVAIGRAAVAEATGIPLVIRAPDVQGADEESYQQLLGGMGEEAAQSPPPVTMPVAWVQQRIARAALASLPVAAVCLALCGMWGWPTRTAEPAGASPGTWLVVTELGLTFALLGVLAITLLLAATRGRLFAMAAVALVATGSLVLAPVLGVLALARPAATRMEGRIGPDAAAELDTRFLDNTVTRWLGVSGLVLMGLGWLALGCAVLACRVLNRVDGYLVLCAVAIAALGGVLSWQFLITVAAMVLLAAGLGLCWSTVRLRVGRGGDGRAPAEA